jgi:hypothetical protein
MRRLIGSVFVVGWVLVVLSSCTTIPRGGLASGEMRLLSMQMPDIVKEETTYDVVLNFEAEDQPQMKRACFHWVDERTRQMAPSLYLYASEVQNDQPIGSAGSRWLDEGLHPRTSAAFCSNIERVVPGTPGRIIVRIRTGELRSEYNKLEGSVEYVKDGRVRETNKVSARIQVEKLDPVN